MVAVRLATLALAAASVVYASPCPFGQMAESGQLSADEAEKFYAARSLGEVAIEEMMETHGKRELDRQQEFYNEQLEKRELTMGGGLLNGQLQPFTGQLVGIKMPTPQKFGLKIIPGPANPYKKPLKTAVRGMCPTLNTMANHGFINRNGITTFAQAADACQITLGFGYDTCTFLSALGLLAGGDLATGAYSIGGQDPRVPNTLGPALGISKHGFFEIDDSISRIDNYFGNNANFHLARYNRWAGIAKKNGGFFNFETMNDERQVSYTQSRNTNPHFNSDAKALAVALAERVFIPRALPNGTHENLADMQNIAPFYLNETFPDNWFRRATAYGLEDVGLDIVNLYAMGPTEIGNNEGVGNFIGTGGSIDLANFSGAEGACFLFENLFDFVPGEFAKDGLAVYKLFEAFINGAVAPLFGKYKCNAAINGKPGKNAHTKEPGKSTTCNQLINGKYQC